MSAYLRRLRTCSVLNSICLLARVGRALQIIDFIADFAAMWRDCVPKKRLNWFDMWFLLWLSVAY